jgi:hypothetical protein
LTCFLQLGAEKIDMGNNAYKKKHRELGLCADCSKPAKYPFLRCEEHIKTHNVSNKITNARLRKKWKEAGNLCRACGRLLDHSEGGADVGRVRCFSCTTQTWGIQKYAGHELLHAKERLLYLSNG